MSRSPRVRTTPPGSVRRRHARCGMPNSSRRSGLRIGRRLDRLVALLHQDHLREASLQFGEPGLEARTLRQCFGQFHGPTLDRSDVRTPDRAADCAASMSDDAVLQRRGRSRERGSCAPGRGRAWRRWRSWPSRPRTPPSSTRPKLLRGGSRGRAHGRRSRRLPCSPEPNVS